MHASMKADMSNLETDVCCWQGVTSPLAGQMLFRSVMFGAFGQTKTWLATRTDGTLRPLTNADYYKVRRNKKCLWPFTVCL